MQTISDVIDRRQGLAEGRRRTSGAALGGNRVVSRAVFWRCENALDGGLEAVFVNRQNAGKHNLGPSRYHRENLTIGRNDIVGISFSKIVNIDLDRDRRRAL
jgi:hypothetical protein